MEFKNLTAPIPLERKTSHYIYEGMSFTSDVREGLQWPTVAENDDVPKLQLRFIEPAPVAAQDDGLTLAAPRLLYDDSTLLAEADVVHAHVQQPQIMLSRFDAEKLGIANGDSVTVSQNGTSVGLTAQVNRTLSEGVALVGRNLNGRPAEKLVGPGGLYTSVKVEKS